MNTYDHMEKNKNDCKITNDNICNKFKRLIITNEHDNKHTKDADINGK